ncbi:hypothetical protein ACP6PL_07815 [Dapis sp. BLCC M126]|uniref:hypothetical protein n=1 Tax=Dapis sp. BLCC M126 TaxID=3400189 RepID=UPI003CF93D63
MPEINWMIILESQQDEFILFLNYNIRTFTRSRGIYNFDGVTHLEAVCYGDDEKEKQMNWFCEELTYKYYGYRYDFPDEFINYKIGKIGEESVKQYLGELISDIDYKLYEWGDGGKDFYLKNNKSVSLQVKTTCFDRTLENDFCSVLNEHGLDECEYFEWKEDDYVNLKHDQCEKVINQIKWKINKQERDKNEICIFVLLLNQVVADRICQNFGGIGWDYLGYPQIEIDVSYSSILCGFKPTDLLEPDTDIYLKDLFYIGGIRGYLKHFT